MAWWHAPGRLAGVIGHLFSGLQTAGRFERLTEAQRHEAIQAWSRRLLQRMGLQVRVHGAPVAGAALVVPNHISWLDIAAVHASCPHARFVSKADVLHWPLLGPLIRASGTLFIERERKRDALRVVHEVAAALGRGETVAVFPEGTTGPGDQVLPFHANLLQAAIAAGGVLQPVLLRYTEPGQAVSRSAQYIGDMTLVGSVFRLAAATGVAVDVHFLPPIPVRTTDRRALAEQARECIAGFLAEDLARHARGG